MSRIVTLRIALFGLGGLAVAMAATAQTTTKIPPGTPVTITVSPATPAAPPASFALGARRALVTPVRSGCNHTGGGNIDVAQPGPDTIVITMTGAAVAYGSCRPASAVMNFDLEQCIEVAFDNPKLKRAKVTLEGRIIGLLRSGCHGGSADFSNACSTFGSGTYKAVALCMEPRGVSGGENLSVNDHLGPVGGPIVPGNYTLHQTFTVAANAPKCILPCRGPSSEFAPDPAVDPLWLSYHEPFHGAAKKDFGFQVVLKIAEDTAEDPAPEAKK